MEAPERRRLSRRELLRACLATPATLLLAACAGQARSSPTEVPLDPTEPPAVTPTDRTAVAATRQPGLAPAQATPTEAPAAQVLQPTPACDDDDDMTPATTEGPFYTPSSPERTSLIEPGMAGTQMVLTGYVLSTDCAPVTSALVDFWHADDAGVYDNEGYRLRGHQFTDDQGRYTLETIVPGLYPGRTRHFHVKVQAPNGPVLTTQLFFPNEPENERDAIFRPDLLMAMQQNSDHQAAAFDFVVERG